MIKGPDPMHVCIAARWMIGGIRTYVKYFHATFPEGGARFTVLAPPSREADLAVRDLGEHRTEFIPCTDASMRSFAAACARYLGRARPDVLHSQGFSTAACTAPLARLRSIPHAVTVHDVILPDERDPLRRRLINLGVSASLLTANAIVAVGEDVARNLTEQLPFGRSVARKIVTIRNGVLPPKAIPETDTAALRARLGLPQDAFLFGYMGRFMAQKGFSTLRNAAEILVSELGAPRPVRIIAVGSGNFEREERAATLRSKAAEYFSFLPFTDSPLTLMRALDALVVPSRWEAMPLLPMEALMCGVPVIGTSCIGLREVLAGTPARVVPPQDSRALAEAMRAELLQPSQALAQEYAAEARTRFDSTARATELYDLLARVAARGA